MHTRRFADEKNDDEEMLTKMNDKETVDGNLTGYPFHDFRHERE